MTLIKNLAFCFFVLLTFGMILIACSDSNGGGSGKITGNVTSAPTVSMAREGQVLEGITVCGLGDCSVTNASGDFTFFIDADSFPGGDVLFTLEGNGFDGEIVITGVVARPKLVDINFTFTSNSTLTYDLIENVTFGSEVPSDSPTVVATDVPGTSIPEATATIVSESELSCSLLSGTYSGDGGCQLSSLTVSSNSDDNVTFTPFGSNSSATFGGSEQSKDSTSLTLVLFGKGGHNCSIHCDPGGNAFTVTCTDGKNSCSESFTND